MAPKRPHDRGSDSSGRRKWLKAASSSAQNQSRTSPGTVVFRVLCPASKSGGLIGKGGGIVTKIREETGAKIKIEEAIPGCDERVVVITSSVKEAEVNVPHNKDKDKLQNAGENFDEGEDLEEDADKSDEKRTELSQLDKAISSSQKALLLVFERIAESDSQSDAGDERSKEPSTVTLRMLVESSQVGCLLGRGGSVIKQMSADSGAQIRVLPKDKLPLCASEFDELVQIIGQLDEARKAVQLVSKQLLDNPSRNDAFSANKISGPHPSSFGSFPHTEVPCAEILPHGKFHLPLPPFPNRFHEPDFLAPPFQRFPGGPTLGQFQGPPEPLTFRLICLADKARILIGKGGSIVRMIQHETSCDIQVVETPKVSEDRIIVITGLAHPDDRISPPQDAVLRVLERIAMPAPDAKENVVSVRILVSSNQTGCLLGKGGSIITEMRRTTRAHIRILGGDQNSKKNLATDEVVQITGEMKTVQEALLHITSRLKHHHFFRERFPVMNHPGRPAFLDHPSPFGPFTGKRELSPPGPYAHLGQSLRKFDSVGGFRLHDEQLAPPLWQAPGINDGVGPMPINDFPGGAPPRRMDGLPGGSRPAVITNTVVDVVVPRSVVSSIYGEDGYSLKQIQQISGADITINESRSGDTEAKIIISGAPDQTHAAQSLIQAFVLIETGSQ